MKILAFLFWAFCIFVVLFAVPPYGFWWGVLVMAIVGPLSCFVTEFLCWWFNPKGSCNEWDYMSDRRRKKYLEEQKVKRNNIRKMFGIKKLE